MTAPTRPTREQVAETLKRIRVRGNISDGAPEYDALSASYREVIDRCPVERKDFHAADAVLLMLSAAEARGRAEALEQAAGVCENGRIIEFAKRLSRSDADAALNEAARTIRALAAPAPEGTT